MTQPVIPTKVGKMSASMLVHCVGVATRAGLCPINKETAQAAPTLCTEYGPNGWMDFTFGENRTNECRRIPILNVWRVSR